MSEHFDIQTDLVLTFDFALLRMIKDLGGRAEFLDKLCTQELNQSNNFVIRDYLRLWNLNEHGEDIFNFREISFGRSLLLEIWNDVVYEVRLALCFNEIRNIAHEKIILVSPSKPICDLFSYMGIIYEEWSAKKYSTRPAYYFPIQQWLDSKFAHRSLIMKISEYALNKRAQIIFRLLKLKVLKSKKNNIFIHEYHPTKELLDYYQKNKAYRVFQGDISKQRGLKGLLLLDTPIPLYGSSKDFEDYAQQLIDKYFAHSSGKIITTNGIDLTTQVKK
jgi:hypothetical protein